MRVAMLVVAAWLWAPAVLASSGDTETEEKAPQKVLIEIYRIAPSGHEALENAWKQLDLSSGVRFFLEFRENILEHSDTFAYGPVSAGAVLESLD